MRSGRLVITKWVSRCTPNSTYICCFFLFCFFFVLFQLKPPPRAVVCINQVGATLIFHPDFISFPIPNLLHMSTTFSRLLHVHFESGSTTFLDPLSHRFAIRSERRRNQRNEWNANWWLDTRLASTALPSPSAVLFHYNITWFVYDTSYTVCLVGYETNVFHTCRGNERWKVDRRFFMRCFHVDQVEQCTFCRDNRNSSYFCSILMP